MLIAEVLFYLTFYGIIVKRVLNDDLDKIEINKKLKWQIIDEI